MNNNDNNNWHLYSALRRTQCFLHNWYSSQWDNVTMWQQLIAPVATFKHTEQDKRIGEQVALSWLVCPIFKQTIHVRIRKRLEEMHCVIQFSLFPVPHGTNFVTFCHLQSTLYWYKTLTSYIYCDHKWVSKLRWGWNLFLSL